MTMGVSANILPDQPTNFGHNLVISSVSSGLHGKNVGLQPDSHTESLIEPLFQSFCIASVET
jgi:hypothetical protein